MGFVWLTAPEAEPPVSAPELVLDELLEWCLERTTPRTTPAAIRPTRVRREPITCPRGQHK